MGREVDKKRSASPTEPEHEDPPALQSTLIPGEGDGVERAQRLENWKLLRAPFWPGFLRSTSRASRVRNLPSRRTAS